jgi:hypothetical protein
MHRNRSLHEIMTLAAETHIHLVCNTFSYFVVRATPSPWGIVCLPSLGGAIIDLELQRWWLAMWKRTTRYLTCLASRLSKKTEPGQIIYVVATALARTLTPMFRTLRAHTAICFPSLNCHTQCLSQIFFLHNAICMHAPMTH